MKPISKSSTTRSVAIAGSGAAAVLTLLELLRLVFPDALLLQSPDLAIVLTWLVNVIGTPLFSRLLAKLAGK